MRPKALCRAGGAAPSRGAPHHFLTPCEPHPHPVPESSDCGKVLPSLELRCVSLLLHPRARSLPIQPAGSRRAGLLRFLVVVTLTIIPCSF